MDQREEHSASADFAPAKHAQMLPLALASGASYNCPMAIYTKRGDRGETSLYDESSQRIRVSKDSLRIEAIGAIDELNSYLGVISSSSEDPELDKILKNTQRDLLTIGSILSGSKLRFFNSETKKIEKIIDKIEGSLPVLKNFVLPGGSQVSGQLQYARALTRKAERRLVQLNQIEEVRPQILAYLNRLSDLLFMLARKQNHALNVSDEIWKRS